ncbi:MAG: serine/threonine-protein phosphatase [Myxococcales bacterium]|nr:serine/threonine-protein phosphatase [Myxococcales bacterium]
MTSSHSATDVGRVRHHNEDVVFADDALGLHAVFDGMGGAANGDVAAAIACAVVVKHVREHFAPAHGAASLARTTLARDVLGQAAQEATRAVFEEAGRRRDRRGMGTTMVVALAVGSRRFVVCSVGDSRAYLVRDAGVLQITKDHTVVADLIERGVVVASEAKNHPFANVLSRNIGAKESTAPDLFEVELEPGERLLLCSDGLTGYASQADIERNAKRAGRESAAAALIEAALAGGGGDNISVVIVDQPSRGATSVTRVMQLVGPQAWQAAQDGFVAELRRRTAQHPAVRRAGSDMAGALARALAVDVADQRVAATQSLLEGWLVACQAHGGRIDELVDFLSDAAAIAESVIMASNADAIGKSMVLDLVLRCFVAANGQVATMLAYELRELQDQLAAQRWKRRERSASHSFADAQTQAWRTVVPDPEPPLSTDALRIVVALQGKLAGAPRDVRAYAQGMCDIATGADPAVVGARIFSERPLERAVMAELWHRTSQGVEHLAAIMNGLRMRQTMPLPVAYHELTMALAAASYRLVRELAISALETIAAVREEYDVLAEQARAQTQPKRPTLRLFAFSAEGGKPS